MDLARLECAVEHRQVQAALEKLRVFLREIGERNVGEEEVTFWARTIV